MSNGMNSTCAGMSRARHRTKTCGWLPGEIDSNDPLDARRPANVDPVHERTFTQDQPGMPITLDRRTSTHPSTNRGGRLLVSLRSAFRPEKASQPHTLERPTQR